MYRHPFFSEVPFAEYLAEQLEQEDAGSQRQKEDEYYDDLCYIQKKLKLRDEDDDFASASEDSEYAYCGK